MIGAILLAAGNSRRFGENKLLYEINKTPMYRYMFQNLHQLLQNKFIDKLVVVTQYDEIQQEIHSFDENIIVVRNSNPEMGISHSVFLGLEKLNEVCKEEEACLFAVADQPYLRLESLEGLICLWKESDKGIAACANQETIGNPVIFCKKYFEQLQQLSGDKGGKQVVKRNLRDTILYQIPQKELEDIDVKEILTGEKEWNRGSLN